MQQREIVQERQQASPSAAKTLLTPSLLPMNLPKNKQEAVLFLRRVCETEGEAAFYHNVQLLHNSYGNQVVQQILAELAQDSPGPSQEIAEEFLLAGAAQFAPSPKLAAWIQQHGERGVAVPVRWREFAAGMLRIRYHQGAYQTVPIENYQEIPLQHPLFSALGDTAMQPVLALRIEDGVISGHLAIAGVSSSPVSFLDFITENPELLGWAGLQDIELPGIVNEWKNGGLHLKIENIRCKLGPFAMEAALGVENETVTFEGKADIKVAGLAEAQIEVERDAKGNLSGAVDIPLAVGKFSGQLTAQYAEGQIDLRGTSRYSDDKLSGEVTFIVTDEATARDVAVQQLAPELLAKSANDKKTAKLAVAGWGTVDFQLSEWLAGRVQVLVDSVGNITTVGSVKPPREVELFPHKKYSQQLLAASLRIPYGIRWVGNVFVRVGVALFALAELGPAKLYDIEIAGRYSTDPRLTNHLQIAGRLNVSALAGLRLRISGDVGAELLAHQVSGGVGIAGMAGVRGYIDTKPVIGYRQKSNGSDEFYLRGNMDLAGQAFLKLTGDLFMVIDTPSWSPLSNKLRTFPVADLYYPLPGEIGIGADIDYIIGSQQLPQVQWREIDFNPERFMIDILDGELTSASRESLRQGKWTEGKLSGPSPQAGIVDSRGKPEYLSKSPEPTEDAAKPSIPRSASKSGFARKPQYQKSAHPTIHKVLATRHPEIYNLLLERDYLQKLGIEKTDYLTEIPQEDVDRTTKADVAFYFHPEKGKRDSKQTIVGYMGNVEDQLRKLTGEKYDGGHLIADQFGGSSEYENLVPMRGSAINKSLYARIEKFAKRLLKIAKKGEIYLEMTIELPYSNTIAVQLVELLRSELSEEQYQELLAKLAKETSTSGLLRFESRIPQKIIVEITAEGVGVERVKGVNEGEKRGARLETTQQKITAGDRTEKFEIIP